MENPTTIERKEEKGGITVGGKRGRKKENVGETKAVEYV